MKTLNIALVAAALLAGASSAFAESPTFKDQMTNLWIATGDANYARAAGLSDKQINAHVTPVHESVSPAGDYSND